MPRRSGDVAAADVDVRPAQARNVLGAEHEIETTTEGITVDQQRPAAAANGGDRERGGEDRGTRPAASANDRHSRSAAAACCNGLHRLCEHPDQPRLAVRQGHDVGRTDGDRVPPDLRRRFGPDDDEDVVAPRQPCLAAAERGVLVEHDDRRLGPSPAGLGRIQHPEHLAARRGGEAEHTVEEVGVGHHHEPAPARA